MRKLKLLMFTDWFPPGYRAGGPIRSTANVVSALKDDFDICVVTSDRDFGCDRPYTSVTADTWTPYLGSSQVLYLSPPARTCTRIGEILRDIDADCVYLNSMFSRPFTMAPLWHAWRGHVRGRVVVAPRGMLHAGAMQFKPLRKKAFLAIARAAGIGSRAWFHATHEQESRDIQARLGVPADRIHVLPNLPEPSVDRVAPITKTSGTARLLYVSRITPIKRLLLLLETLGRLPSDVVVDLTVAGPVESAPYWEACQTAIASLPPNVTVHHVDAVPHAEVRSLLESHHVYVLPTLSENYGHGIIEALGAGRPVVISDQTPWRGLEAAHAGWDVPVDDAGAFLDAVVAAVMLDQEGYDLMSAAAWSFAKARTTDTAVTEAYKRMFAPA